MKVRGAKCRGGLRSIAAGLLLGLTSSQADPAKIQTYLSQGKFAEAAPLLESLAETTPSAPVLLSLGMVRDALGDSEGAIAVLEVAATEDLQLQGDIADALGRAYQHAYRFGEAEVTLKQAIRLRENSPEWLRASQDHLGLLYLAWGRHDEAGAFFRKTLSETSEDETALRAQRHGYLGRLFLAVRSYGLAREQFVAAGKLVSEDSSFAANEGFAAFRSGDFAAARQRFLAALDTLPEEDRPEVFSNLGQLALAEGDPEAAIDAFTQAARLLRMRFGEGHPAIARAEYNLGEVFQSIGEVDSANQAFTTALGIAAGSGIPEEHVLTVQILRALGLNAHLRGDQSSASDYAFRATKAGEVVMRRAIAAGNNRQRLNYRSGSDILSLPATLGSRTLDLANLLIRTKGLATPTKKQNPELRALQLKIDQLRLAGKPVLLEDLAAFEAAVDSALPPGPSDWQALQKLLPERGVFIDFLAYTDYAADPPTRRYGAMVTPKGHEPIWVPLGSDARLERWLAAYGRKVRGSRPGALTLHGVLRGLSKTFWEPIEEILPENTETLILAPDAGLHFLPFSTLLGENGDFLCERFSQVVTVGSARDLLPQPAARADQPWQIFAVSDYESGRSLPVDMNPRLAAEIANMPDLKGAHREARLVGDLAWSEVSSGEGATEAALKELSSPRVLHLVAHGFYLGEEDDTQFDFDIDPAPYYQSGVVLSGSDILFAEEAADLDLTDTWIATVSSCSSALGMTASGEGVVGLRRALSSAGARNVLLTLWPVSDAASPHFMHRFYKTVQQSQNPPGALWSLQREELRRHFPKGEMDEEKLARAVFLAGSYILSHRGAVKESVPLELVAPAKKQIHWRVILGLGFVFAGIGLGVLSFARSRRGAGVGEHVADV